MLMPKKTKYRKAHNPKMKGKATQGNTVSFGSYGLQSLGLSWVSSRQIEAARRVMTKYVKRGGKIWIRIFPDVPITKKGGEMPMGKGMGAVDYYIAVVKPGTVMFEMDGVEEDVAKKAMKLAAYKLPIKCKVISKQ